MKMRHLLIAAAAGGLLVSGPALADEGDPVRGAQLAETCLGCHAVEGLRNAYPSYRVPKLGGQTETYLFNAMLAYRDGMRAHPTMRAQASSLSEEEMRDIAAFFAQPKQ
ncbi:MAG: c-type cytochrome [Ectothiorhodospiraceae bacterium]|nr:c-type cytochrome [Ectothiorhodospiraceae bacterium]